MAICLRLNDMTQTPLLILAHLRIVPCADVADIAKHTGVPEWDVQTALHDLDDQGKVIMRNGWYRLSEAERKANG